MTGASGKTARAETCRTSVPLAASEFGSRNEGHTLLLSDDASVITRRRQVATTSTDKLPVVTVQLGSVRSQTKGCPGEAFEHVNDLISQPRAEDGNCP